MKATGIIRIIDDLGSVVNQGTSAPIRTSKGGICPTISSHSRYCLRLIFHF